MGLLDLACASESPGELVVLQTAGTNFMIPSDGAAAGPGTNDGDD